MYAATRGRFGKNVVLPRAFDYFILRAKSLKRDESFCLISEKTRGRAALPLTACFLSLRAFSGLSYYRARANSLFPLMPFGISGAKAKNVVFAFAS